MRSLSDAARSRRLYHSSVRDVLTLRATPGSPLASPRAVLQHGIGFPLEPASALNHLLEIDTSDMTQEKENSGKDDVAKPVDLVNSPDKEKSVNASSEKKAKKSSAKNAKSKVAEARDREVGNNLKRLAVVSGLNAPQFMDATDRLSNLDIGELAKMAVKAETVKAEIAKAAPKRRRRPKPATAEEEREEEQTFGNLALQIAAAPQAKRAKKSAVAKTGEEPVATDAAPETEAEPCACESAPCDAAPETEAEPCACESALCDAAPETEAESCACEPAPCDAAPETEAEPCACESAPCDAAPEAEAEPCACESAPEKSDDSDLMNWDFDDSLEVSWGRSPRADEPPHEDTFPINMDEDPENTDDLLDELFARAKHEDEGVQLDWGLQEEESPAEEPGDLLSADETSDVVGEEKDEGIAFDDFWGDAEPLEISWGRPRQEKKSVKEDKKAPEPCADVQEPELEPEAQAVVEEAVAEPEPEPAKPLTLDNLDFNDADNLAAFFDCGDSEDLGFTPKKAKKEERAESCEKKCACCSSAKEDDEAIEKREERAPRPRRERRAEEPEERAPRRNRRETEDFEEQVERAPRRNRRETEDFEEQVERAPRRNRRETEDFEEPVERAPRRNRRETEDFEEPVERAPRRNRRESEDFEEPVERAPRRNRRETEDFEEPVERAPRRNRRESEDFEEPVERAPRRNRREAEDVEEPVERAPRRREAPEGAVKPVLPTWDDAVGYVVAFNQSRRSMRGRAR